MFTWKYPPAYSFSLYGTHPFLPCGPSQFQRVWPIVLMVPKVDVVSHDISFFFFHLSLRWQRLCSRFPFPEAAGVAHPLSPPPPLHHHPPAFGPLLRGGGSHILPPPPRDCHAPLQRSAPQCGICKHAVHLFCATIVSNTMPGTCCSPRPPLSTTQNCPLKFLKQWKDVSPWLRGRWYNALSVLGVSPRSTTEIYLHHRTLKKCGHFGTTKHNTHAYFQVHVIFPVAQH